MKDYKYKVTLTDLYFKSYLRSNNNSLWDKYELLPTENFPGLWKTGMNEKNWNKTISPVRPHLNNIINRYDEFIHKTNINEW